MSQKVIKVKGAKFFKPEFRSKVQEAVYVSHEIAQRASLLIKDYYLSQSKALHIDEELIKLAFDVVQSSHYTNAPQIRKSKTQEENKEKIYTFQKLKKCYEGLFDEYVSTNLSISHILSYKRQEIETAYLNNIVFHYTKYITKLLKLEFDFDYKEAKRITYKIITKNEIPETILDWCKAICPTILEKRNDEYLESYIETKPWSFFNEMVSMTLRAEAIIQRQPEKRIKLYTPFPMISSFVPSHIHLDTSGMVQLLLNNVEDFVNHYEIVYDIKLKVKDKSNVLGSFESLTGIKDPEGRLGAEHNTRIWEYFCCFSNKKYKKIIHDARKDGSTWVFDNSISTDGVSTSFYIVEEANKKKKTFSSSRKKFTPKKKEFTTLDDLSKEELKELLNGKMFAGDPGKVNIGVFTDGQNNFSYTSQKRRFDLKQSLFRKKHETLAKEIPKEYQDALSSTFSRSLDRKTFKTYVRAKFSLQDIIIPIYRKQTFRSYKFSSYCLSKSTEAKFVNDIKKWVATAHDSEIKHPWMQQNNSQVLQEIKSNVTRLSSKPVIFYGNGGKNGNNLKGRQAAPNISFERLLAKHFRLIEVSETMTSQTCPCCRGVRCMQKQKFENRKYTEERHQLLRCKNVECHSRWWSRDILGSFNILYLTIEKILEKLRE